MTIFKPIEENDAQGKVKEIYEEINQLPSSKIEYLQLASYGELKGRTIPNLFGFPLLYRRESQFAPPP